eukprot:scaffold36844_cov42-Cyclotella_meneghiniana.AAC.7
MKRGVEILEARSFCAVAVVGCWRCGLCVCKRGGVWQTLVGVDGVVTPRNMDRIAEYENEMRRHVPEHIFINKKKVREHPA